MGWVGSGGVTTVVPFAVTSLLCFATVVNKAATDLARVSRRRLKGRRGAINNEGSPLSTQYIISEVTFRTDPSNLHMSNRQYSFIRNLIAAGHGRPKPCKATGTLRSDTPNR